MPYPFRGGAQSSRSIASNLSGWKWNTPRGPCKTATSHLQTDRSPTDLASFLERLLCPFLCLVLSLWRVVRRRVPFLSLSPTLSSLVRAAPSSLSVPFSLYLTLVAESVDLADSPPCRLSHLAAQNYRMWEREFLGSDFLWRHLLLPPGLRIPFWRHAGAPEYVSLRLVT